MRALFTIVLIIQIQNLILSQDCIYNYDKSTAILIPKDFTQTSEIREINLDDIEELKNCLIPTDQALHQYWLNNKIANKFMVIEERDSIAKFALAAFKLDSSRFCHEYVKILFASKEEDFPFENHYLDRVSDNNLSKVKSYCREKYFVNNNYSGDLIEIKNKTTMHLPVKNEDYILSLRNISTNDQKKRKEEAINWDLQNKLDSINRVSLDSLFNLYGFPTSDKVSEEGVLDAFMVLHHSTDCTWNEKWTKRWLENHEMINIENLLSFYFYRNFNNDDGICNENVNFLEELKKSKNSEVAKKYLNFSIWEKKFNKKK